MSGTKLLEEFPPVSTEQWMKVVEKDLKGAEFAKKLLWQTDEGIAVKPFYRSEDLKGLEVGSMPGQFPYTRGTRLANDWKIRETIEESNASRANQLALQALSSGAEEICFVVGKRGTPVKTPEDLKVLLDRIKAPVHFDAGEEAASVLRLLLSAFQLAQPEFEGSVDYDPLSYSSSDQKDSLDEAANLLRAAKTAAPRLRALVIRGYRFHDGGGTAVQELGYALAQAVQYVADLTERGFSANEACSAITFSFAVGSSFFMEIAKLRAARTVWAQAARSFGASEAAAKATIFARTSRWNKSIFDLNMLRGATEAMAAAIGGCDAIAVAPFDELYRQPDEVSRRLARNTQLILKRESLFDRVTDPAGGSYYVEVLTDSLARAAWKAMQDIEAKGGFLNAVHSGVFFNELRLSREAKETAVAVRRRSIVGVNHYPNPKDRVLPLIRKNPEKGSPRAAQAFEHIRLRTESYAAKTGKTPLFLLAETGDVKMRRARSGFALNFFGCAGFDTGTAICKSAEEVVQAAVKRQADAVVLCSSDEEYPKIAGPVVTGLKAAGMAVPVIVAGFPKDAIEQLKQAGVADFIHVRSNAVQTLSAWQDKLGVKE